MFTQLNENGQEYLSYDVAEDARVDALCYGMLMNNEIFGLVPLKAYERDGKRELRYNVTGLTPLGGSLVSGSLTCEGLVRILQSLSDTLARLEDYLIPPELLVYQIQYLYLELGEKHTMAVCLPVRETENGNFRTLCNELMHTVHVQTEADRMAYRRLQNVFADEAFGTNELREALEQAKMYYDPTRQQAYPAAGGPYAVPSGAMPGYGVPPVGMPGVPMGSFDHRLEPARLERRSTPGTQGPVNGEMPRKLNR